MDARQPLASPLVTPSDVNPALQEDVPAVRTIPVELRSRIQCLNSEYLVFLNWAWAAHDPQHFAAVAPIVGGIGREGPKAVTPEFDQWAGNLAQVTVYAFVGALDTTVPPERSERMISAIRKAGGREAKLKVYPDEGHGAGRAVVVDQEFYNWLFSPARDEKPLHRNHIQ